MKKYTIAELSEIYLLKKIENGKQYELADFFIELLRKEIADLDYQISLQEDPNEGDNGSHQDQAPQDFLDN